MLLRCVTVQTLYLHLAMALAETKNATAVWVFSSKLTCDGRERGERRGIEAALGRSWQSMKRRLLCIKRSAAGGLQQLSTAHAALVLCTWGLQLATYCTECRSMFINACLSVFKPIQVYAMLSYFQYMPDWTDRDTDWHQTDPLRLPRDVATVISRKRNQDIGLVFSINVSFSETSLY